MVPIVAGVFGGEGGASQVDFGAHGADPACVCVDDAGADSDAGGETELFGCFRAESAAFLAGGAIGAVLVPLADVVDNVGRTVNYRAVDTTNAFEVIVSQFAESN